MNRLVNYGRDRDIKGLKKRQLRSVDASRLDLIVRWGGGHRLSRFLPIQSVYTDFFIVGDYWLDFEMRQFGEVLHGFRAQDQTLGGVGNVVVCFHLRRESASVLAFVYHSQTGRKSGACKYKWWSSSVHYGLEGLVVVRAIGGSCALASAYCGA